MLNTIAALTLPTATGYLASVALLRNSSPLERAAVCYPLGTSMLTMTMFILGLMRIPFTAASITAAMALISAIILLSINKKKTPLPSTQPKPASLPGTPALWQKVLFVLLIAWIASRIISVFYVTSLRPIWGTDALMNWSLRAEIFYYDRGLYLHPDDYFARSAGVYSYPLHNSLMQVWLAICTGSFDKVLVKMWIPPYLVSVSIFLYLAARQRLNHLWSALVVLFFLSSSLMTLHATEPYSDFILSVYIAMAYSYFLRAIKGDPAMLRMSGIFSCGALFIKNETVFFVAGLLLTTVIWAYKHAGNLRWQAIKSYIIPLAGILPYVLFKITQQIGFGQSVYEGKISFHPESLVLIFLMETIGSFNLITLATIISVFFAVKYRSTKNLRYVLAPAFLYILSFVAIYTLNGDHAGYLERGTTFFRNMLTYYPMLFLLSLTLLTDTLGFIPAGQKDISQS